MGIRRLCAHLEERYKKRVRKLEDIAVKKTTKRILVEIWLKRSRQFRSIKEIPKQKLKSPMQINGVGELTSIMDALKMKVVFVHHTKAELPMDIS